MAISPVYTTPGTGGTTGTVNYTVAPPDTTGQVGDVAVICVGERSLTEGVSGIADTATGTKTWTKLRFGAQSSTASTGIWYRVLQSGDPGVGNTDTVTLTNTVRGEAAFMLYRGVDTTTPIDAQGTTTAVNSTSQTFKSVTSTLAGAMYVGVLALPSNVIDLVSQTSGSPTLTKRVRIGNGGSGSSVEGMGMVDGLIANAGATGDFVWSLNGGVQMATDSFALKPAPAGVNSSLKLFVGQAVKRAAYF